MKLVIRPSQVLTCIVTLACICLVFALSVAVPATYAQPIPLTPAPPSTEVTLDTLNRAVEALETLSASSSSTVNAAVVLQSVFNLIIFGGGLVFVWRGGLKPLHSTMENDRKRAEKAEQDEERTRLTAEADQKAQNEIRLKMSEALQKTAEAQERMANNTETKTEAGARTNTAVTKINDHTDDAHKETRREIKVVSEKLDRVIQLLGERTGDAPLEHAQNELIQVKQTVIKLSDTGELQSADVPPTDPAKQDLWDGDHPPEA